MTQEETNIWKSIQLKVTKCRLWRNQRYKGQIVANGKITKAWANCGVGGDGGGDLVGLTPILITPDMVGRIVAVYTEFETKIKDKYPSPEQRTRLAGIKAYGGIAGVARSAEDAQRLVDEYIPTDKDGIKT